MTEEEEDDGGLVMAAYAYKDKFGQTPTIITLSYSKYAEASKALRAAIDANEPFKSDTEFFKAIGVNHPPEDAIL